MLWCKLYLFVWYTLWNSLHYRRCFVWTSFSLPTTHFCNICCSSRGYWKRYQKTALTITPSNMCSWANNKCWSTDKVSKATFKACLRLEYVILLGIYRNKNWIIYNPLNFSYYRNASGKYVTATTGSTVATSIYPTTVTGGSSTPGLATHYSSYPGGAVRLIW